MALVDISRNIKSLKKNLRVQTNSSKRAWICNIISFQNLCSIKSKKTQNKALHRPFQIRQQTLILKTSESSDPIYQIFMQPSSEQIHSSVFLFSLSSVFVYTASVHHWGFSFPLPSSCSFALLNPGLQSVFPSRHEPVSRAWSVRLDLHVPFLTGLSSTTTTVHVASPLFHFHSLAVTEVKPLPWSQGARI